MPSSVVGGAALRKAALNWSPWVRSLTHVPLAWTNSPALIAAAAPTTVTSSRCPRTLTRSTQKPVSGLWKVTRSTRPAKASRSGATAAGTGRAMLTSCGLGRDPVPGEQLQPSQALGGDPVLPAPRGLEPAAVAVNWAVNFQFDDPWWELRATRTHRENRSLRSCHPAKPSPPAGLVRGMC